MSGASEPLFHEEQSMRRPRLVILTAIPPLILSLLAIWQVGLGHPWGKHPMSNASIIGWTIFLWLIYLRLMTVKLVTDVGPGEISVRMRGLWRSYSIALSAVKSARAVSFDPARDWGGYGARSSDRGRAFIAAGGRGVELELVKGGVAVVGSQRPDDLARAISSQLSQTRRPA